MVEARSGVHPSSGLNRTIKTLLRQVCGFRVDDFLKPELYALREPKHKLVG